MLRRWVELGGLRLESVVMGFNVGPREISILGIKAGCVSIDEVGPAGIGWSKRSRTMLCALSIVSVLQVVVGGRCVPC